MKITNNGYRLHGQDLKLIFVNLQIGLDNVTEIVYNNNVTVSAQKERNNMKFTTHNNMNIEVLVTTVQGVTRKPYESMAAVFGEAKKEGSSLRWDVVFEDGTVALIKNVEGPVSGVYTIAGNSRESVILVNKALKGTL